MTGRSGSGKTNAILNLIKQQGDDKYSVINKIYLCDKDPNETNQQDLIKKPESSGIKRLKDPKALIEYPSNNK